MKIAAAILALTVSTGALANGKSHGESFGFPSNEAVVSRIITITPSTRWINVHDGETVRFVVNGKSFAWTFDIPTRETNFPFSKIAPGAADANGIQVYVAPNPQYFSS